MRVHLLGVGGISMSGIAQILIKQGYQLSGSDLRDSHLLKDLRKAGAEIHIGHQAENVKGADLVVVSNAIPEDNPELIYARQQGIPVWKRAQMIAKLMEKKKGIAVAGTHGKTTTTSLLATLLKEGGLDPTILVGGELDIIGGNAYLGEGDYLLTEADESDGSFLYYHPQIIVVTNLELDHHDYYDSQGKLFSTFSKFIHNLPEEDGLAVFWGEDEGLAQLIKKEDKRAISYGFNKGDFTASRIKLLPFGSLFDLMYHGHSLGEIHLQIPGKHNILNALAAIAVAKYLGLEIDLIKKALQKYQGTKRRFEKKGLIGSILVVDDYAHHPTEIKATISAAKNTGYERLIVVFQPHRYSRTKHLLEEFTHAFTGVDHLIITDIYSAGESPLPGVKAEKLAAKIAKTEGIKVDYIANLDDIVAYLAKIVNDRDLVLTLGAGDVYKVGELLVNKMKKQQEMA